MKLSYKIRGDGEPFMILHGLYGMSDNWMSIVRKMKGDFKFILPDLRNHGETGFDPVHTYDAMVEDVFELAEALGISKMILLGHSMGGKVAMRFALKYPQKVKKLVVVDIAPKNYSGYKNFGKETANHTEMMEALMRNDISTASSREEIDEAFKEDFPNKILRAFLLKNISRTSEGNFQWVINLPVLKDALKEVLDGFGDVDGVSKVDALFVRGDQSPYILPDDLFYIKNYFPNAELVTIPNAGHWVHAQQPGLLINTLTFFLS